MNLNLDQAVHYHDGRFPPETLDYSRFLPALLAATDALARYDQMLKSMHNSEILLAPLRSQEAVISSRMEGTISTMDEILQLEAEYEDQPAADLEVRSEVIETVLYQRSLRTAQQQMEDGYPTRICFPSAVVRGDRREPSRRNRTTSGRRAVETSASSRSRPRNWIPAWNGFLP